MTDNERFSDAAGASSQPSQDWLRSEISAWVRDRLVTAEQSELLLARYGLAGGDSTRSLRWRKMASVLGALGAVLIGGGIVLIMASNWEEIPRFLRLVILIGATLVSYAAGYYLAYEKRTYPGVGKALVLLGSLIFGASIFLIGQMYHLSGPGEGDTEYSAGFFWWFLGVLPLAYVLWSPVQLVLALAVGTVWVQVKLFETAAFGLPEELISAVFLGLGSMLYAIGLAHRLARSLHDGLEGLQKCYTTLGVVFVLGALYVLSFELYWRYYSGSPAVRSTTLSAMLFFPLAAAVLVSVWNLWRAAAQRERTAPAEAGAAILLALVGAGVIWLFFSHADKGMGAHTKTLIQIAANVLLLLVEIGVIALGWRRLEPGLLNLGLLAFFVHLMTRYFDVIGSMLQGGLAFIGAGILLLGGGWLLENARRRLLQTMPPPPANPREAAT